MQPFLDRLDRLSNLSLLRKFYVKLRMTGHLINVVARNLCQSNDFFDLLTWLICLSFPISCCCAVYWHLTVTWRVDCACRYERLIALFNCAQFLTTWKSNCITSNRARRPWRIITVLLTIFAFGFVTIATVWWLTSAHTDPCCIHTTACCPSRPSWPTSVKLIH